MDADIDFRVGDVLIKDHGYCEFWIVTKVTYHKVWFAQISSIKYFDDRDRYCCLPDLEDVRAYGPSFIETWSLIHRDRWARVYLDDDQYNILHKWDGEPYNMGYA